MYMQAGVATGWPLKTPCRAPLARTHSTSFRPTPPRHRHRHTDKMQGATSSKGLQFWPVRDAIKIIILLIFFFGGKKKKKKESLRNGQPSNHLSEDRQ
jgi:hypothetical protein